MIVENDIPFPKADILTSDVCLDRKYVIIATIDGTLTAVDFTTGNVCWTTVLDQKSFLSSTLSNLQVKENGNIVELVPSLDGHFFKYDKFKVTPIDVTVDDLLDRHMSLLPFMKIYGGKLKFLYGIDRQTGEICYNCSINGCENIKKVFPENILTVEQIVRNVNSVDSISAEARWNLRIGELHITIPSNTEYDDSQFYPKHNHTEKNALIMKSKVDDILNEHRIKISLSKGLIGRLNQESLTFSWLFKANSSIIDAWLVDKLVYRLDPFANGSDFFEIENENDKFTLFLYLGCYMNQLFIVQSNRVKIKSPFSTALSKVLSYEAYCLLQTGESSFLQANNTNAVIPANAYINDDGHYFYVNFSVYENDTHCIVDFSYPKYSDEMMGKYFWIKLISTALILIISLGSMIGCMKRKKYSSEGTLVNIQEISINSQTSEEFVSRFNKDFNFIAILGRGGFGLVMEAKNKIDDCVYAVKRIPILVDGEKEHGYDSVLREVKALAMLDHPHIVRYFNSWVENPPKGWQCHKDKELNIVDATCSNSIFDVESQHSGKSKHYPDKKEKSVPQIDPVDCNEKTKDRNEIERAEKIADRLKINPLGNFNFNDWVETYSNKEFGNSFSQSSTFENSETMTKSSTSSTNDSDNSTTENSLDSSDTSPYDISEELPVKEINSNKIMQLQQLESYMKNISYNEFSKITESIPCMQDFSISSNCDKIFTDDDVFFLLELINECLTYKLSQEKLLNLKSCLFVDSSSTVHSQQNWISYLKIFKGCHRKDFLTLLLELRNWLISVLCLICHFESEAHDLVQKNLCNILWDVNLTLENRPITFHSSGSSGFESQNSHLTRDFSCIANVNAVLAWPMKIKFLLQLKQYFYYNDSNFPLSGWNSIFDKKDHVLYIKNLRLFQIWMISILCYLKPQKCKKITVIYKNMCDILFYLNKLLEDERNCLFQSGCPVDTQRSLLCSTVDFLKDNYKNKKNFMFHKKQLQKALKPNPLKKFNQPGFLYIQMQLCQRGSLQSWLHVNSSSRHYEEIMKIFLQIIDGIDYVHTSGLMHRDLKPSNIYFSKDGLVKIGDFGLATTFDVPRENPDISSVDYLSGHTHGIGTRIYMSPEQQSKKSYDSKTDMYSLGIIFYELLLPMKTNFEKNERITSARSHVFPPQFIQQFPRECELIRKLMSNDPALRPSASELKCHPLLQPYFQQTRN